MSALSQLGLLPLLMAAALAWGFARVLDAPRWTGPAILLAVALAILAGQVLLPPEAPFRRSSAAALQFGALVALLSIPVLAYRWVLRRARARNAALLGSAAEPRAPGRITGRVVRVAEAQSLAADLRAGAGAAAPADARFGLIRRAADGGLDAAAVCGLSGGVMTVAPTRIAAEADPAAAAELARALVAEARDAGAAEIVVPGADPALAAALAAEGFAPPAPGARLLWRRLP